MLRPLASINKCNKCNWGLSHVLLPGAYVNQILFYLSLCSLSESLPSINITLCTTTEQVSLPKAWSRSSDFNTDTLILKVQSVNLFPASCVLLPKSPNYERRQFRMCKMNLKPISQHIDAGWCLLSFLSVSQCISKCCTTSSEVYQ